MSKAAKLSELLGKPTFFRLIGAHNGLTARLGERAGFDGIWASSLEVSASQGGGMTNPKTWQIWQDPFPVDTTVRSRQKIYINKLLPKIGEGSD